MPSTLPQLERPVFAAADILRGKMDLERPVVRMMARISSLLGEAAL